MAKKSLTTGISSGSGDIEEIGIEMNDRTFNPVLADDNMKLLKIMRDDKQNSIEPAQLDEMVNKAYPEVLMAPSASVLLVNTS